MKDHLTPGEYRKELYDYLEAEGLEVTDERHEKIRYLVKMAAAVSIEDKSVEISRLASKLLLYREKFGELEPKKKEKQNDPKYTPNPETKSEPRGDGWHAPRTFG